MYFKLINCNEFRCPKILSVKALGFRQKCFDSKMHNKTIVVVENALIQLTSLKL